MVKRLTELKLNNFRIYKETAIIRLNGDIVLLYGPNGSGKTSLLHGLECAITGSVRDLMDFEEDYPRCLKNINCSSPAMIKYKYLDIKENVREQEIFINGMPAKETTDESDKAARRNFVERCYLSQARLGRLLEIYQKTDSESKESPLVQFVRELLGLESLDNLIKGLHDIEDIRRLRNASNPFSGLEYEVSAFKEQRSKKKEQITLKTAVIQEDVEVIKSLVKQFKLKTNIEIATATTNSFEKLEKLLDSFTSIESNDRLNKLHGWKNSLEDILNKLMEIKESTASISINATLSVLELNLYIFDTIEDLNSKLQKPMDNSLISKERFCEMNSSLGLESSEIKANLSDYQKWQFSVNSLFDQLKSIVEDRKYEDEAQLQATLESIQHQKEKYKPQLVSLIQDSSAILKEMGCALSTDHPLEDIGPHFNNLSSLISRELDRCHKSILDLKTLNEELGALRDQSNQKGKEIEQLRTSLEITPKKRRSLLNVLRAALECSDGNICPVCARDYSELNKGGLKDHVKREAEIISAEFQQIEAAEKTLAALKEEFKMLTNTINERERVLTKKSQKLEELQKSKLRLSELFERFHNAGSNIEKWQSLHIEAKQINLKLESLKSAKRQIDQINISLLKLAEKLNLKNINTDLKPWPLAKLISTHLNKEIGLAEQEIIKIQALKDEIHRAEGVIEKQKVYDQSINIINQLIEQLNFTNIDSSARIEDQIAALQKHIDSEICNTNQRSGGIEKLRQAISRSKEGVASLDCLNEELSEIDGNISEAKSKLQDINAAVKKARTVQQAANTVKTDLTKQIFNDRLNKLFFKLFDRLAKNEEFSPRLREPTLERGKIFSNIQGRSKNSNIAPFENIAAVVSSSNLNTAALSLFFALNLIEEPQHHVIVLDDPVQSMDDVRVIQFAGLLRSIAHEARRQLVIAVHEKPLFDFLCMELGPTCEGETLIKIELEKRETGEPPIIQQKKIEWEPDQVRFGA